MSSFTKFPVVLFAPLLLGALVVLMLQMNFEGNDGHLTFALDDPYIHMAMARNLIESGTWGINPGEFSSTSSAPLHTLFLAGLFLLTGPTEFWAWLICIAGALLAVVIIELRAKSVGFGGLSVTLIGLYFILVATMAEFAMYGMEHTLHICAIMAVMAAWERVLSRQGEVSVYRSWPLLVLMVIATGLRYESLFLVPPMALSLWFSRRRTLAIALTIVSVVPALVLGLVQLANGARFLPNTMIVKAFDVGSPGSLAYGLRFLQQVSGATWVVMIIASLAAVYSGLRRGLEWSSPLVAGPAVCAFVILAHCYFAITYMRYTGYLLALGLWVLMPWVRSWTQDLWNTARGMSMRATGVVLVAACLSLPFAENLRGWSHIFKLGREIYLQQHQMAEFLARYYDGRAVALNDIGMISWRGHHRVLDLWGLANDRVARWRYNREYSSAQIAEVTKEYQVPVAVIYPSWFLRFGGVPTDWYRVGNWQLPSAERVTIGHPVIFFYATNETEAHALLKNLKEFEKSLPSPVLAGY